MVAAVVAIAIVVVGVVAFGGICLESTLSIISPRNSTILDRNRSSASHTLLCVLSNGWQGFCRSSSTTARRTAYQRRITVSMIGLLYRFGDHDLA